MKMPMDVSARRGLLPGRRVPVAHVWRGPNRPRTRRLFITHISLSHLWVGGLQRRQRPQARAAEGRVRGEDVLPSEAFLAPLIRPCGAPSPTRGGRRKFRSVDLPRLMSNEKPYKGGGTISQSAWVVIFRNDPCPCGSTSFGSPFVGGARQKRRGGAAEGKNPIP